MKTILNRKDNDLVVARINSLSEKNDGLWGKMNVNEMICHCTDQIKMAEGKIEIKFVGNFFLTKFMKNLILLGMPAPKGKVKTYKELDQKARGTKPTEFESDRNVLIETIKNFKTEYPNNKNVIHPSFGELSLSQWGRLINIHLDHHLRQFGC
jgi:hypothetical protein